MFIMPNNSVIQLITAHVVFAFLMTCLEVRAHLLMQKWMLCRRTILNEIVLVLYITVSLFMAVPRIYYLHLSSLHTMHYIGLIYKVTYNTLHKAASFHGGGFYSLTNHMASCSSAQLNRFMYQLFSEIAFSHSTCIACLRFVNLKGKLHTCSIVSRWITGNSRWINLNIERHSLTHISATWCYSNSRPTQSMTWASSICRAYRLKVAPKLY